MPEFTDSDAVKLGPSTLIGLEAQVVHAQAGLDRLVVKAIKRSVDIIASGVLLLSLLPIVIGLAILIRLDSPGPCFIRCDRVGFRGRPLRMLKLRKMRSDVAGLPLTTASDERFTRLGRFLAKYKFDELPQLWHVLIGEMSIIGPRPETRQFVERHAAEFDESILRVRPGILGLSQIAFARESAILEPSDPMRHYVDRILPQKVALDSMYASNLSIRQDVAIFFWGVVTVLLRRPVAVDRNTGEMNLRHRNAADGKASRHASHRGTA